MGNVAAAGNAAFVGLGYRAQQIHSRAQSSFPQQQAFLHFLIFLRSGSVSTRAVAGSLRGMSSVTAGLGRLSKICRGHPLSLPVPSIAVLLSCSQEDALDVPHNIQSGSTCTMHWASEGHTEKLREPQKPNLPWEKWSWQPCGDRLAAQWRTRGKEQQWCLEDHKHEGRTEEKREGQHPRDI